MFCPYPATGDVLLESGSHNGLTSRVASSTRGTPREGVQRAPKAAKLATRATPEPVPAPVMVGRLMTNAGTGAERP